METSHEMLQELTLTVPVTYSLPPIFSIGDPEAIAKVLTLGAEAYELIYARGSELRNENEFELLKKRAEEQYRPRLEALEKATQQATSTIEQQQQKLQQEATDRLTFEQRIRAEEQRNREELLAEKQKHIEILKKLNEELQQTILSGQKSVVTEFHSMKDQILRTTTSNTAKGSIGEFVFQDYLKTAFGSVGFREHFNIEYKGKEAHMGDIHMEVGTVKSLWEVKNYNTDVPKKEDEKFLKDMETNPQIQYGVLVSLHSPITNHKKSGCTDIHILPDGRFCLYISEFLKADDPLRTLFLLKPCIEALCEKTLALQTLQTTIQSGSEDDVLLQRVEQLQQNRKRILAALQEAEKRSKDFYTQFKKAKKNFDEQWIQLEEAVRPSKDSITNILRAYEIGVEDESEGTSLEKTHFSTAQPTPKAMHVELKGHIFTKTERVLYTSEEQEFIQRFLTHFEQQDTEEDTPKKILKDLFQKEYGMSEDKLIRLCKSVFTDQAWGKGHKFKYVTKKTTNT